MAKERREEKETRKEENKAKGLQYQVVSTRLSRSLHRSAALLPRRPRRCSLPSVCPRHHRPALQISDSRKLKKMSRKQLKLIKKADTTGKTPILAKEKKRKM